MGLGYSGDYARGVSQSLSSSTGEDRSDSTPMARHPAGATAATLTTVRVLLCAS